MGKLRLAHSCTPAFVPPALDPGVHRIKVFMRRRWIAGSSPAMTTRIVAPKRTKHALAIAISICALMTPAPLTAKTLVFCSEGSPENFYPGINTTGTSLDANSQIYSRIVDFERGGTTIVPGL